MNAAAFLLPSCRDVTGSLTDYLEGQLPWRGRMGVRIHLGMCPTCRRFLASLRTLPAALKRALGDAPPEPPAEARAALEGALVRLGLPRRAAAPAETCHGLLAAVQRQLRSDPPAAGTAFPTPELLALLPPRSGWKRLPKLLGLDEAHELAEEGGASLCLVALRPGRGIPRHRHLGREDLLVLQGGLEDGDRHLGPADHCAHEAGSAHAPRADRQGCWALVRIEGGVEYSGWRGWAFRRLRPR